MNLYPPVDESLIALARTRRRAIALKLSIVARQLRVTFDQAAEQSGLTRSKWTLIATVARHPGATQRTIAEALEVREISAGRLIDRLCKEGYLERREHPSDRRAYSVYLTPKAQPVLDTLDALATTYEGKIFSGFSAEDLEKLDALLSKISRNLTVTRDLRVAEG